VPSRPRATPFGNLSIVTPKLEILAGRRFPRSLFSDFIVWSREIELASDLTVRPKL
jgi:hypothetical protein